MTELKRCPFCWGEAKVEWLCNAEPYFSTFQVFCSDCGIYIEAGSQEEAIKKWNTRPNPWHTGTPTEATIYLCFSHRDGYFVSFYEASNGKWMDDAEVEAWQNITPFEGEELDV